jgi:hypothetical protein
MGVLAGTTYSEATGEKYISISGISGPPGEIRIEGPQSATVGSRPSEESNTFIRTNYPNVAGTYRLVIDGETVDRFEVTDRMAGSGNRLSYGWNGTIKRINWPDAPGEAEEVEETQENYDPDGADTLDPSNYAGIVNADNEEGIALAPRLRREGASLGPEGATVNLPDGRTVEVGAIQEADEVARVIDGENAGDVIDADQPATDSGDGQTSGSGDLGMAAAVVGVLALGYAATRR